MPWPDQKELLGRMDALLEGLVAESAAAATAYRLDLMLPPST
jgi:hypothetical protein